MSMVVAGADMRKRIREKVSRAAIEGSVMEALVAGSTDFQVQVAGGLSIT
jgi:hypothetical protein